MIDPGTGAEKLLHSFGNGADGQTPEASLIAVNSTLYGTTSAGGGTGCNGSGCGTVFSIDANTGMETILYSFTGGMDGANPSANLIDVKGTLYGTTIDGGGIGCSGFGCGTVFSIEPNSGMEKVLYSFCSRKNCTDGANPNAGLIAAKGNLYGTTSLGGGTGCSGLGCGTVFALNRKTGIESVLYSFNGTDGQWPMAAVINVRGTLYGTTEAGGTNCTNDSPSGCGTVFALDLNSGAERVLYSFCNQQDCRDGLSPYGNLVNVKGKLYGTTPWGGANCTGNNPPGCGTIFAIDSNTGAEIVLYSFSSQQNGADGKEPFAGVVHQNHKFYGTILLGGSQFGGAVFAIKEP